MMTYTNFGIELGPAADVHSPVRKRAAAANTCTPPMTLSSTTCSDAFSDDLPHACDISWFLTSSLVAVSLFAATL